MKLLNAFFFYFHQGKNLQNLYSETLSLELYQTCFSFKGNNIMCKLWSSQQSQLMSLVKMSNLYC